MAAIRPTPMELPLDAIEYGADGGDALLRPDTLREGSATQPISVREAGGGRYVIVAGRRRLEAARAAGRATIPAVVATESNSATLLEERLWNEAMPPLDEARVMADLLTETGWTQTHLAERLGRRQSSISNLLRLLDLDPAVQAALSQQVVSFSHAKALASLPRTEQVILLSQIVSASLSSRAVEEIVRHRRALATVGEDDEDGRAQRAEAARLVRKYGDAAGDIATGVARLLSKG